MPNRSSAASLERPAKRSEKRRAASWCRHHGVSLQTFHRWRLRPDGPPCYKVFGTWFVDDDEMDEWIEARSQRPDPAPPPAVPVMTATRRREVEHAMAECAALHP